MKKYLLFALICLLSLISFSACEKENINDSSSIQEPDVKQFQDPILTEKISKAIDAIEINYEKVGEALGIKSFKKDDFDLNQLFSTKMPNLDKDGVIALYKFNTDQMRLSLVIVKSEDGFENPFLVKTTNGEVVYLSLKDNYSIYVNEKNDKLHFESKEIFLKTGTEDISFRGRGKCTGQAVADCMNDGYTNHGWTSVGLLIVSAIIWETIVIAGVACAVANC